MDLLQLTEVMSKSQSLYQPCLEPLQFIYVYVFIIYLRNLNKFYKLIVPSNGKQSNGQWFLVLNKANIGFVFGHYCCNLEKIHICTSICIWNLLLHVPSIFFCLMMIGQVECGDKPSAHTITLPIMRTIIQIINAAEKPITIQVLILIH